MKKAKLLELIQKLDDNDEILFQIQDGCCDDSLDLIVDDTAYHNLDVEGKVVIVKFSSLPGYRSCIQAGQTKRADQEYWEKHAKSKC